MSRKIKNKLALAILSVALLVFLLPKIPLQTQTLPLHVEGRYIKDGYGGTVTLVGVNQEGFLDSANGWWNPEGGGYTSGLGIWNPDAVKYNLDSMKSWGCNVLRLHTKIQWWLENTDEYQQHLRDVITWAGERGIYVIFEPYSVMDATQYPLPFPPYIPAGHEAVIPSEQAFVDYWASVANELRDLPNVLFELYNEPHYNGGAKEAWFRVAQDCIAAIRATGADQIIIVQWGYGIWCNLDYANGAKMDWVEAYPLSDPLGNIVYSFHNYRSDFHRTVPTRVNVWEYDDIKEALQICLVDYVLNTLNKPVLCGEIGANMWETGEGLTRELAYFNNSLTIYNEWEMSYIAWVWTVTAHMRHGLLQNALWLPPPNAAGTVLINAMLGVPSPPPPEQGVLTVSSTDNMQPVSVNVRVYSDTYDETHTSPFSLSVPEENYTLYTSYGGENYEKNITVNSGYTTTAAFAFESEIPSTEPPPPTEIEFEFDIYIVLTVALVAVAIGLIWIPKRKRSKNA